MATEVLQEDELVSAQDTAWPDLCSVQGLRPSKRQRLEVLASRRVPLPPTYTANTLKEELCLEYVEHFRKQFVQLFPDRKPLFLVARNEAGVPKFVCSTLRPTQLPYKTVYDLHTAAAFVANYMEYEPLPHPLELPQFLPSPSTVLQWRAGDSFDLAVLLASLLLGDGYDAYVVVGTAPRWITLRDLSHTSSRFQPPPLPDANRNTAAAYLAKGGAVVPDAPSTPLEETSTGTGAALGKAPPAASKYLPSKNKPRLASKYLARMAERDAEREAEAERNEYASDDDETHQTDLEVAALQEGMPPGVRDEIRLGDPLEGRRVHAWVLVRPGKRNMTDSVFVEPSTGEVYPLEESPYFAIESVFNDTNLWVNMQTQALVPQAPGAPPPPTSAAAAVAADARAMFRQRREAAADATVAAEEEAGEAALADKGVKGGSNSDLSLEERLIAGDFSFLPGISEVKKHNPRAEELVTGMPDVAPTASAAAEVAALPPVDLRAELAAVGVQLNENKEIVPLEEGECGAAAPGVAVEGGSESKEGGGKESESKDDAPADPEEHVAGTGKEVSRLLSYDLSAPDDWEYVFVEQTLEELGGARTGSPSAGANSAAGSRAQSRAGGARSRDDGGGAEGKSDGGDGVAGDLESLPLEESGEHVLDPPPTWGAPISVSREDFEGRFGPSKARTTRFKRAILEECAPLSHPSGMEARLTLFTDTTCLVPRQKVEVFSHRKDLLLRREFNLATNTVTEHFGPGRYFREKRITEELGRRRVTEYYVEGKTNGLRRREEVFGQKIMWFYTRRPNFLVYRSATLGECVGPPPDVGALNPAGASSGMGGPAAAGAVAGSRRATERSAAAMDSSRTVDTDAGVFVVRKMAEKYDRNPAKPAHNDICKMSYFMSEGTIQARYHFVDGHITQNTRLYHNDKADGQMDMLTRDETTPIPKPFEVEVDYKAAMTARINCYNDVRAAQKDAMKEIPQRVWDEENIVLERNVFEIAQEAADSGAALATEAEVDDDQDAQELDYLAPFLHDARDRDNLTDAEAEVAVTACRAALAERHKNRARIVQARLTAENEALEKRQREFSRMNHAEPNAAQAQAAFEEFCLRSLFVIGILEERLKREDEMFEAKLQANEERMRSDERLRAFFAKGDSRAGSRGAAHDARGARPGARPRHK